MVLAPALLSAPARTPEQAVRGCQKPTQGTCRGGAGRALPPGAELNHVAAHHLCSRDTSAGLSALPLSHPTRPVCPGSRSCSVWPTGPWGWVSPSQTAVGITSSHAATASGPGLTAVAPLSLVCAHTGGTEPAAPRRQHARRGWSTIAAGYLLFPPRRSKAVGATEQQERRSVLETSRSTRH